jgi:hypothetical protein
VHNFPAILGRAFHGTKPTNFFDKRDPIVAEAFIAKIMPTVQGHGAVNFIFTVANTTLDKFTLGFVLLVAADLAVFKEIFDIFWDREKSLQRALQEMVLFEKLVGLKLGHGVLV